ncbi:Bgt-2203 [Blumeria graminis f. sp. tritici]|uniref:Bgt-2203 n=2 Tax=Blumeria graminis f. sp. tritici TaxID=62690 RepID=A0A061HL81_BLUGR|nr:hypothetical protein BGT96224_2203 [Blumeria graminis f. sp. tritici 96224]VDB94797.1 Bgt-2203 [Blumeria graminis f. sp. tritici]
MENKPKSLESILDEERREVLAMLEGTHNSTSTSYIGSRKNSLSSLRPVPSMLDFSIPPVSPMRSSRTSSARKFSPQITPVRSMLDAGDSPHSQKTHDLLNVNNRGTHSPSFRSMFDISPTTRGPRDGIKSNSFHLSARSASDASSTKFTPFPSSQCTNIYRPTTPKSDLRRASDVSYHSTPFEPRVGCSTASNTKKESAYELSGYMPSNTSGSSLPKRNKQARKITSMPSVMSDAMRGELGDLLGLKDIGIHGNIQSKRVGRSFSPHDRLSSLFTRNSDANLIKSPGSLSSFSMRKRNHSDATILGKPRFEDFPALDEEVNGGTSDDSGSDEDIPRGRNEIRRSASDAGLTTRRADFFNKNFMIPGQMATAEEKRQQSISSQYLHEKYKIRSLFEPKIIVTEPSESAVQVNEKPKVHPNTSFDEVGSGIDSPHDSETEAGISDIKRAQNLAINTTAVISTPSTSRCVRSIHRGDFAKIQQEARNNQRRVRKYLVATDLSEEAVHALEWTIGTVLRDGDVLLAIYCADEDTGNTVNESSTEDKLQDQIPPFTGPTKPIVPSPKIGHSHTRSRGGSFADASHNTNNSESSSSTREKNRAEQERYQAVQDITDRVSKLLRKTKLQVKVVIEVIHCKSPKHLITEVIDYISPTLVILGSRGRSALKGVILGSFSNYIVTKSSVPVMVARKRLRKQTKYKRPSIRLANNLETPQSMLDSRTLAAARID